MISDTTDNQISSMECANDNIKQNNNVITLNSILNQNVNMPTNQDKVELTLDTHDKLYSYFVNELTNLKKNGEEKDLIILNLTSKINELESKLEELENKLTKKSNIDLLIKLKENFTNKQNELSEESSNTENTDSENTKNNLDLIVQPKKPNIIIEEDTPSLKPRKKPNVFGRRF